jgi:hypothetical protein
MLYFTGHWDGCNLWAQWDAPAEGGRSRLLWRLRAKSELPWSEWRAQKALARPWLALPLWRPGYQVQVAVGPDADNSLLTQGEEVTFLKPRCRFVFRNQREKSARFDQGTIFHAIVDQAPCVYRLLEDVDVPGGGCFETEMEAESATGWNQLDHFEHWLTRPLAGIVLANLLPSTQDVQPTGADFTTMTGVQPDAPVRIALRRASVR